MPVEHSLLGALELVLRTPVAPAGQPRNADVHLLDYRDKQTFRDLWLSGLQSDAPKVNKKPFKWTDANQRALIIGNEPPDDVFNDLPDALEAINFRGHFTATSWLAAWRVKFPEAAMRIAVIDPRAAGLASGSARALQTILAARDATGQRLVPGAAVLNAPNLRDICDWLSTFKTDTRPPAPHLADLLRSTIWTELTSDREQNHALSNVLGALLLRANAGGKKPGDQLQQIQDCLEALASACGIGPEKKIQHGPWIDKELAALFNGAVLIDDMAELWEGVLRAAFAHNREGLIRTTAPGKFKETIESAMEGSKGASGGLAGRLAAFLASGRKQLSSADIVPDNAQLGQAPTPWNDFVLFLDLRLGLGKPTCEQLRLLGKGLLNSRRTLPWLSEAGRRILLADLQGDKTDETLLPRMIALLDPTLPIVIFSSTHRTELIDPFRDYANIITTFRKPILNGLDRNWLIMIQELRADFVSALQQAASILKVRRAFSGFSSKSLRECPGSLPESSHGWLIEVFVDESEKDSGHALCAGGIIAVRALGEHGMPAKSDRALFEELLNRQCLWGWCADAPKEFQRPNNSAEQRGFLGKGSDLRFRPGENGPQLFAGMIDAIQQALGDSGKLFPFATIDRRLGSHPKWMQLPAGITSTEVEKLLDATLRNLIQHALETLFSRSSLLRPALQHPNTRIAIDLGIRDYPCSRKWPLFEAFGLEMSRENGRRPSLHSEDGFRITSDTVARTGVPWPFQSKIKRARAVALQDFGSKEYPSNGVLPKQLHYFADTIAHVALHDLNEAITLPDVGDFFASGWIADLRNDKEELERLLIGREWDQGDRIGTMRRALQLQNIPRPNGLGIDLFRELDEGAARLTGEELKSLFEGR